MFEYSKCGGSKNFKKMRFQIKKEENKLRRIFIYSMKEPLNMLLFIFDEVIHQLAGTM